MKNTWKRGLAVLMVGGLATLGLAPVGPGGSTGTSAGSTWSVAVGVGTLSGPGGLERRAPSRRAFLRAPAR
jgi:hypothetical protein